MPQEEHHAAVTNAETVLVNLAKDALEDELEAEQETDREAEGELHTSKRSQHGRRLAPT